MCQMLITLLHDSEVIDSGDILKLFHAPICQKNKTIAIDLKLVNFLSSRYDR